ncbi:Gfo/Idh/MocA family protein [Methylomonas sp. DH-1]|uniref:Gfo/Idh/MocA family protein n=1 Tax=Methylomonas sp. (strain DH-1) TaxID=1727196 RepID=UPI000A7CDAC9|nr:Gfo/Idh/MocA family oxidoreductase [Methylomonas sp. DH-1]
MSNQTPKRLALIGLGNQGQEYLKAISLSKDVELVAVVDSDVCRLEQVKASYEHLNLALHDQISALHRHGLDGLILALPHHCYIDVWQEILALGCPLLKEKPLGRTLDEARELLAQARMQECPLQTAIQRRHHPTYLALKRRLTEQGAVVKEAHAHLHLGFSPRGEDDSWRGRQSMAGGGVLLDSGYHMVDLLHYLIGPFDLVAASLWRNGKALNAQEIEDEAYVIGRAEQTWIMLESHLAGEPYTANGSGYRKSEGISLLTDQGIFFADRQGVYQNGILIENHDKEWRVAMANQLNQFARNIQSGNWSDFDIWDQLPAMQLIEHAYKTAHHY